MPHHTATRFLRFWLPCFVVGAFLVSLGHAQGSTPKVVLKVAPRTLERGKVFSWKGHVTHLSVAQRKRGVMLSFSVVNKTRTIPMGTTLVTPSGTFSFKGQIPKAFQPKAYRVQIDIWRRAPTKTRAPLQRPQAKHPTKNALPTKKKPARSKSGRPGRPAPTKATNPPNSRMPGAPPSFRMPPGGLPSNDKRSKIERERKKKLWKQLREGWGPGSTKEAEKQRKRAEQQRKKTRFLLPPVGPQEPPVARSPRADARGRRRAAQPPRRRTDRQDGRQPGQQPGMKPKPGSPGRPQGRPTRRLDPGGQQAGRPPMEARRPAPRREAPRPWQDYNQSERSLWDQRDRAGRQRRRQPAPQGSPQRFPRQQARPVPGAQPPSAPVQPNKPSDEPPVMMPSDRQRRRGQQQAPPIDTNQDRRLWSRSNESQLDLRTKGGNTYLRQVFEPYLPQHQRITVFDTIALRYQLSLSSDWKRVIRVGGARRRDRSYFVGRIRVVLFPGRWTAIPSVAPDARILWYRTRPRTRLVFAKNKGDIMFVRTRSRRTRSVFLEFGTDGDKGYFGGPIPAGIRAYRYPRFRRNTRIHASIRRKVLRRLHYFGVRRSMTLKQVLSRVVPYLRGFTARKLRPGEKLVDPYLTLVRAKAGVCRHRAMVFTVTMQALGYPARFVANNAHAFAELRYPDGRWRQIDLGGGDVPHYMGSWKGKSFKEPKDPFPKPPPSKHVRTPHPHPDQRHGGAGPGTQTPLPPGVGQPGRVRRKVVRRKRRKKKKRRYVSHTRL